MIDKTSLEQQALESALPALAEAVAEIGAGRPLPHYSREEILRIGDIFVHEYHKFRLKLLSEQPYDEDIPV